MFPRLQTYGNARKIQNTSAHVEDFCKQFDDYMSRFMHPKMGKKSSQCCIVKETTLAVNHF